MRNTPSVRNSIASKYDMVKVTWGKKSVSIGTYSDCIKTRKGLNIHFLHFCVTKKDNSNTSIWAKFSDAFKMY